MENSTTTPMVLFAGTILVFETLDLTGWSILDAHHVTSTYNRLKQTGSSAICLLSFGWASIVRFVYSHLLAIIDSILPMTWIRIISVKNHLDEGTFSPNDQFLDIFIRTRLRAGYTMKQYSAFGSYLLASIIWFLIYVAITRWPTTKI